MNKITPFLWFNDNAEDAAEFYLSVFPQPKKLGELRSSGVGPWPAGKIATISIELMGQQMTVCVRASTEWMRKESPSCPDCRGQFCDAMHGECGQARQDTGEVVTNRDFEAAAAFNDGQNSGHLRASLGAA
jgi:3-demethylubiquinone-9 3-methyltransferase